jgi:hypothetical protein
MIIFFLFIISWWLLLLVHHLLVAVASHSCCVFFLHQLRIRVECAFGILVNRWAILRSIIPAGISVKRTVALVVALAKLHNFCIDATDDNTVFDSDNTPDPDVVATTSRLRRRPHRGAVPLVATHRKDHGTTEEIPVSLLDGGEHFLDHPRGTRRSDNNHRVVASTDALLPRELMLRVVVGSGMVRPTIQSDGAIVYGPI